MNVVKLFYGSILLSLIFSLIVFDALAVSDIPELDALEIEIPQEETDCELSRPALAIYSVVGEQPFCNNVIDSDAVIILPPGRQGFDRFANLAEDAHREILFVNMLWDDDQENNEEWKIDPNGKYGPGTTFLIGIYNLYEEVKRNEEGKYSEGISVKILLGLKKSILSSQFRRPT